MRLFTTAHLLTVFLHLQIASLPIFTLPTKVHIVKATAFPVIMYRCYSWTMKMPEHWRIHAFQMWCWRRLLRVPWTARRSKVNPKGNQHWILIGRTVTEAPILWPPDAKRILIGKDSHAGKDWGREKMGAAEDEMIWWHHQINEHEFEQLREIVKDREAWHAAVYGILKSQIWLSVWTTPIFVSEFSPFFIGIYNIRFQFCSVYLNFCFFYVKKFLTCLI